MRYLVSMDASGRLTIPAATRKELGLKGAAGFETEVASDGSLVLRPSLVCPREDAWAYVAVHRELLERAHADSREGRIDELTEKQLAQLGDA